MIYQNLKGMLPNLRSMPQKTVFFCRNLSATEAYKKGQNKKKIKRRNL